MHGTFFGTDLDLIRAMLLRPFDEKEGLRGWDEWKNKGIEQRKIAAYPLTQTSRRLGEKSQELRVIAASGLGGHRVWENAYKVNGIWQLLPKMFQTSLKRHIYSFPFADFGRVRLDW